MAPLGLGWAGSWPTSTGLRGLAERGVQGGNPVLRSGEEEHEFSDELEWCNPTGAQQRKIYWHLPTDFGDRDLRTDQYRWLPERVEAFHRILAPRVKALPVPE